jgi:hypothetical protein
MSRSAGLMMRLLGLCMGNLVVAARVLAAHSGPNPGERDVGIAEVVVIVLLLAGILLASFWPKRRKPSIRKRRFRLK